jgi:hypothetical protein
VELRTCPHCGVRVIASDDGTCPSCRKRMPPMPGQAATQSQLVQAQVQSAPGGPGHPSTPVLQATVVPTSLTSTPEPTVGQVFKALASACNALVIGAVMGIVVAIPVGVVTDFKYGNAVPVACAVVFALLVAIVGIGARTTHGAAAQLFRVAGYGLLLLVILSLAVAGIIYALPDRDAHIDRAGRAPAHPRILPSSK